MTAIYRGRVTRVESKGVHVLLSDLHPTSAFLCRWQGGKPSVGASVLVADTSDSEVSPDLTVIGTGGANEDGTYTFGGLRISSDGGGWVDVAASQNNLRLWGGSTQLRVRYNSYVDTSRQTAAADPANALVTKGYVDAIKAALAASTDFADFKARVAAL